MDGRLTSEGALDFDGYTSMMHKLLSLAWGSEWGTFTEESPTTTDATNVKYPIITYGIEEMRPGLIGKSTREIKPRQRHSVVKDIDGVSEERVAILGQRLDYVVEFQVWEENKKKLMDVHKRFRDFMKTYTGYMMQQGVVQITFVDMKREPSSLRDAGVSYRYRYLVTLEEVTVIPQDQVQRVIMDYESGLGEG